MTVKYKHVVFALLLVTSLITNAQNRNSISSNSVPTKVDGDSTIIPTANIKPDYANAYEIALKRKEELTNRKAILNDSIKKWKKELNKLDGLHTSILKSNEKLEEKIAQVKKKEQNNGIPELIKKSNQLQKTIMDKEKNIVLLESKLHKINDELDARNLQRENLGKIKDNVSNQMISENKDYLERPFSEINPSELISIKSKCQKYAIDAKVNAFVAKIDIVIKNKELYDKMVNVVNAAFKKPDVDRALASITQIKGANMQQQQEISELKSQLSIYHKGLTAFKDFITELNRMRKGVNYSMEFFQTDRKQILSKNDLENRINSQLIRVPYLKKKYEEFLKEIQKNPNNHPEVEKEILEL